MLRCTRRKFAGRLAGPCLFVWLWPELAAGISAGEEATAFAGGSGDGRPSGKVELAAGDGLIGSPEPGWPQWRGPRRDGISNETGLRQRWPSGGPTLAWKAEGLGTGWSSPIVTNGRLFITGDVGDELVIYAFDMEGSRLWRTTNGRSWTGSFPGARASCVYSEGRVYHLNAHGRVVCLEAASGEELWAVDILKRFQARNITWALSECLLVDGPRLIVTPGGRKALMAALDKNTGRTIWMTPPLGTDRTSHSSPILFRYAGRRLIANCSSAHGFGVDADTGELLWAVPLRNQFETNVSTPIYGRGCLFYVTPYAEHGRLYRLRTGSGRIEAEHVWTSRLDTVTGSGVLIGGTLYAAGYRAVKRWLGVDWASGKTKYEFPGLTTGATVYADGCLYCLDERGNVGLLKLGPGGPKLTGKFRLVTRRIRDAWAHPVVCDARLYLRYHDTLWCYDLRR